MTWCMETLVHDTNTWFPAAQVWQVGGWGTETHYHRGPSLLSFSSKKEKLRVAPMAYLLVFLGLGCT